MRVVVDTNIVFSAILNTNSRISKIILQPKSLLNFYSTEQLEDELAEHWNKLKNISKYSDIELHKVVKIVTSKIRFINVGLISRSLFRKAANDSERNSYALKKCSSAQRVRYYFHFPGSIYDPVNLF